MVLRQPNISLIRHLKPLYVTTHLIGQPINKVLIDNGAIVNILPSKMMKVLGKTSEDLIPTEITVGNFTGGCSPAKGVLSIQLQIGNRVTNTTFFVIDACSNYNVLLGRDWIHVNGCVPSSLHQALIFLTKGDEEQSDSMEVTWADANPFKTDVNNVEADLYTEGMEAIEFKQEEVQANGV